MCGIAGIVSLNRQPINPYAIKAMCDVVAHRGPDDAGYALFSLEIRERAGNFWFELTDDDFKHKNVHLAPIESDYAKREIEDNRWHLALGHRRLAVIDLTPKAHQPMSDRNKNIWITYNGEVYNFKDLRAELEKAGYTFFSNSDTEVIINCYKQWGVDGIHKFNGMFAFALWDNEKNKLFLVRDRYGIKPLYYYFDGNTFIFASEIKAILQNKEVKKELCLEALSEYFTFQNIYSDKTLFKGIKILPAGHYAVLSTSDRQLCLSQYWDFSFAQTETSRQLSFADASLRVRELFQQAVTHQLVSDVPLGSYLSGGMDSGSIVSVASRAIPRLMTFTGGFDLSSVSGLELSFDERQAAELMASTFLTEHYEMVMHSGDMAWVLPKLIWHLEDLRVGMSYQNWYIARLASKFVKVVLAGTGGDELFAGYPWRYSSLLNCRTTDEFDKICYRYWQRLLPDENKPDLFSDDVFSKIREYSTSEVLRSVMAPHKQPATLDSELALNRVLYFEAKTFLHGLLIVEDKISMSHSLETRVPFLDNDLVDFVLALPAHHKLNLKNFKRGNAHDSVAVEPILSSDGKYILRHAMQGLIPDTILHREKQGFSPPDNSWYRGETMNYIKNILLAPQVLSRGYFKPKYIRKIVDEHTKGKVNHRLLIWSLLCFEWWNREFIDKALI